MTQQNAGNVKTSKDFRTRDTTCTSSPSGPYGPSGTPQDQLELYDFLHHYSIMREMAISQQFANKETKGEGQAQFLPCTVKV